MTDLIVPPEWEELRSLVAKACGTTLIVGGALRDLDNGVAVKDIDLFVLVPPLLRESFDPAFYEAALRCCVPGLEVTEQLHTDYCDFRDEVFHVTTCRVAGFEYDVQIIFAALDTEMEAIERVDFGLCQIGWTGAELIRSEAYDIDKACRQFTLLQCPSDYHRKRSVRRYERFLAKYPDWDFYDPSEYELL